MFRDRVRRFDGQNTNFLWTLAVIWMGFDLFVSKFVLFIFFVYLCIIISVR